MQPYIIPIVILAWIVWLLPFFRTTRTTSPATKIDKSARWGIILVAISYSLLWQTKFWEKPVPSWRLVLSILFLILAPIFSWTGARALGKQWRIEAGLSLDHELITVGPYKIVRHPIYTSMLYLIVGTGLMITPIPLLAIALIIFMIGTEIRVRSEEKLLAARFGEKFTVYKNATPAYIPFLH